MRQEKLAAPIDMKRFYSVWRSDPAAPHPLMTHFNDTLSSRAKQKILPPCRFNYAKFAAAFGKEPAHPWPDVLLIAQQTVLQFSKKAISAHHLAALSQTYATVPRLVVDGRYVCQIKKSVIGKKCAASWLSIWRRPELTPSGIFLPRTAAGCVGSAL